jgi:hypothetical protein
MLSRVAILKQPRKADEMKIVILKRPRKAGELKDLCTSLGAHETRRCG